MGRIVPGTGALSSSCLPAECLSRLLCSSALCRAAPPRLPVCVRHFFERGTLLLACLEIGCGMIPRHPHAAPSDDQRREPPDPTKSAVLRTSHLADARRTLNHPEPRHGHTAESQQVRSTRVSLSSLCTFAPTSPPTRLRFRAQQAARVGVVRGAGGARSTRCGFLAAQADRPAGLMWLARCCPRSA